MCIFGKPQAPAAPVTIPEPPPPAAPEIVQKQAAAKRPGVNATPAQSTGLLDLRKDLVIPTQFSGSSGLNGLSLY